MVKQRQGWGLREWRWELGVGGGGGRSRAVSVRGESVCSGPRGIITRVMTSL